MKNASKLRIEILIYKVCIYLFISFSGSVNNRQGKSTICKYCVVGIVSIVDVVCVSENGVVDFFLEGGWGMFDRC